MKVYSIDGIIPVIHPTAYVHPTAVLIGNVIVGPRCYVGPLASLRGDFGRIIMNEGSNVQDSCILHGFPESTTIVDVDGHVGHGAILHSCTVSRNALIGMNSVVMDDAVVGENSFVSANAFVKAGMIIPPRSLAMGSPANKCSVARVPPQLGHGMPVSRNSGHRLGCSATICVKRAVTGLASTRPASPP